MQRQSSRKPKPIQREGFVKLTSNLINKLEEDLKREREENSGENSPSNLPSTSSATDPSRRPTPPPYIKRCNDSFTPEGSQAIFNFILGRIRSKNPNRFGRVAKRRVELMRNDLWEKCRIAMGCDREAGSYRNHFNQYARQLHFYEGISLLDKVDLYYALDIKPDPSIRQRLIQNFGVHFDDSGLIAGSDLLHHWDLVHPDSEPEYDEDGFPGDYDGNRYTEYDDGLMWQFIVDDVNADNVREKYNSYVWNQFKKKNKGYSRVDRVADSYKMRFERILLPNLHKMPFDLVTTAVLYYKLGVAVPMEFRSTILEETSATLDEEGFIAEFPDCPDQIVLQSHPYNTVIGITSTSRLSTLKAPTSWADTVPYTPEEDKQIWQYIVWRTRVNGKCQKIKEKMSGWAFWKQFQRDCPTERTWKSLSEHFMEDLRGTIMDLHYDLKTKIELYFALSVPVEEETLREFQTIAVVVLAKGYIIKYAAGRKFSIGRKDNVTIDEKELEDLIHNEEEKCKMSFLEMRECERKREEEEEMKALEHLPNNERFPYLNFPQRSQEACRKRKQWTSAAVYESKKAKPDTPEPIASIVPKVEEVPIEEQKPTDLLLAPEDVKMEPVVQDFPPKIEKNFTDFIEPEPAIPSPPPNLSPNIVPYTSDLARHPVPYCPRIKKHKPVFPPPRKGPPPVYAPPPKHHGPPPPYVPQFDTRLRDFLNSDRAINRTVGGAIPERRGTPPPYIGIHQRTASVKPSMEVERPAEVEKVAVGPLAAVQADGKIVVAHVVPAPAYPVKKSAVARPSGPGIPYTKPSQRKKAPVAPAQPVKQSWPSTLRIVQGRQTTVLNRVPERQQSMTPPPVLRPFDDNMDDTSAPEMPKIEEPEPEVKTETPEATGFTKEVATAPIEVEEPIPEPFIKIEMPEDMEQLTAAVLATMVPVEETKPDVGEGLFQDDGTERLFFDDFEQDPADYQGPSTSRHVPYIGRPVKSNPPPIRSVLPPRPSSPVPYQGWKKGPRAGRPPKKQTLTEQQREQNRRDLESRVAERVPNFQIKPALLLAATLPETRSTEDKKYFGSQKPEDRIKRAFGDVEEHLKTFTKEMEAIRPHLTKKERESCMYKLMEVAKGLRNDAKMSLIKGHPNPNSPE